MSLPEYPQAYSLLSDGPGLNGACSFLGGPVIWEELDGGRGRGSLGQGARSRPRPPHMSCHLKTPMPAIYPPFTSRSSDPKMGKLRQGWTDLYTGVRCPAGQGRTESRVPSRRGQAGRMQKLSLPSGLLQVPVLLRGPGDRDPNLLEAWGRRQPLGARGGARMRLSQTPSDFEFPRTEG